MVLRGESTADIESLNGETELIFQFIGEAEHLLDLPGVGRRLQQERAEVAVQAAGNSCPPPPIRFTASRAWPDSRLKPKRDHGG